MAIGNIFATVLSSTDDNIFNILLWNVNLEDEPLRKSIFEVSKILVESKVFDAPDSIIIQN